MQESGVAVNDLYSLVVEQRAQLARGDRFRWKAPAYELMGKQIAETITNPFFPRLWSSHELSQRPPAQKQIPWRQPKP